jgi:protein SCO1/2
MRTWTTFVAIMAFAVPADAVPEPSLDEAAALQVSQQAIGNRVASRVFTDSSGKRIDMTSLRGRPVIVSLIYTSCYHTCPLITRRLSEAVNVAREILGDEAFAVLTIGFDARADSPERMHAYAHQHGIDQRDWYFLSGDHQTITGLARDLGFVFYPSPRGFDHLAQITVLDRDGRVYRQIYGENFSIPALTEPLRELALGLTSENPGLAHWLERVRLFCTVYDPASGRYRFDYSIAVAALTGLFCLGLAAAFIVHAWRHGAWDSGD